MKIAFIPHAYPPAIGGAEVYAHGLAEACAEAGHDVHVITPDRVSAEAFYEYGHARIRTAPSATSPQTPTIHRVRLNPRRPWFRRASGPIPVTTAHRAWRSYCTAVQKVLDVLRPDATVVLPHAFPNVRAAFDARNRGHLIYIPLLHEEDPAWDLDTVADFVQRADTVVALTRWEERRLVESYGAADETTIVVPPGITAPDPEQISAETETPYIVSLGRRVTNKHLGLTAEAIRQVREHRPDLRFLVVGAAGDASVDAELASGSAFIDVVGEVDDARKWQLLRGAMAVVSMSDRESFGISTVEAQRMRTPVICRTSPVAEELIDHERTGLLVESVQDLSEAIKSLMDDPDRASHLGAAGYESSLAFTWRRSRDALLKHLEGALPSSDHDE